MYGRTCSYFFGIKIIVRDDLTQILLPKTVTQLKPYNYQEQLFIETAWLRRYSQFKNTYFEMLKLGKLIVKNVKIGKEKIACSIEIFINKWRYSNIIVTILEVL